MLFEKNDATEKRNAIWGQERHFKDNPAEAVLGKENKKRKATTLQ